MNLESYLPPRSERRGRFEKLRQTQYQLTAFFKIYYRFKQRGNPDAVFMWLPRTGGTSFFRALENCGCVKLTRLDQIYYRFANAGLVTFSHCHYPSLLSEGFVDKAFDQRAFKFAIVRNPYDRFVSLFHYFIKQRDLHPNVPFHLFVQLLKEGAVDDIGLFNVNGLSQCQPQSKWLTDESGKLIPDYIGRYEALGKSYATIMNKLGLSAALPHINETKHRPYMEYYDPESLKIVEDYYAEDFERFEYKII
jgi:hypothetical protein